MSAMACPLCGETESQQVIVYGLPARICPNEGCHCLFGGAEWLISRLPFNGWFMAYEGSYWRALWHWLTRPDQECP